MTDRSPPSTVALLGAMLHDTVDHVGKMLDLARIEIGGNIRVLVGLIAMIATAVILIVVAFFLFLATIVGALAVVIGSEPLAAVIVASPFALAAVVLTWMALRRISLANLMPRRTGHQVAEDARAVLNAPV